MLYKKYGSAPSKRASRCAAYAIHKVKKQLLNKSYGQHPINKLSVLVSTKAFHYEQQTKTSISYKLANPDHQQVVKEIRSTYTSDCPISYKKKINLSMQAIDWSKYAFYVNRASSKTKNNRIKKAIPVNKKP